MARMSHTRLGVFVVAALALLVALVVALGGGDTFRRKVMVETYFDESVQGLDIGSKVRYRGVTIGAVSSIGFTYTRYEQGKPVAERKQYVLVEMAVYPDLLGTDGAGRELVDRLVADGLRIRMAPIGITGIAYMELDYRRNSPVLPIAWAPDNIYIPSTRSTVLGFVDAAERILGRLAAIDLEATVGKLDRVLSTLDRQAEGLETAKLSKELATTLVDLRRTLASVERLAGSDELKALPAEMTAATRRLRELAESQELLRTLAALDRTSGKLDRALSGREDDIANLIANLRAASVNLKTFSDRLHRDPAGTLLAAPPRPSDAYAP